MAVDVGAVLSRAYHTVVKHRVLWVLGLIVALLSSSGNSNFSISENERIRLFNVDLTITPELGVVLATLIGLLVIALFIVRAAFDAGLIAAGDASARDTPPTFREAWAAGKAGMWRVLLLNLISACFVILLVLGVILFVGLTVGGAVLLGLVGGQMEGRIPELVRIGVPVGIGLVGLLILIAVAIPVGFLLAVTTQIAQRAAVIDQQPIGQAWSTGWHTARSNAGNAILVVLAQFLVNVVVGALVAAIVFPLVGLPVAAVAVSGAQIDWGLGSLLLVVVLVAALLRAAVIALPTAWNSLVWTLFYRAVTVGLPQAPGSAIYGGRLPPTVPGGVGH